MQSLTVQSSIATSVIALASIIGFWLYRRNAQKKNNENPPAQWREVAKLTKVHLYPLKSGRRIELQSAECTKYGIIQSKKDGKVLRLQDRSFIVYGAHNNEFKTARTFPKMVLIEVSVHDDEHVSFDAPGMRQLYVKIPKVGDVTAKKIPVVLHEKEEIFSLDCGEEASVWISRFIYGKESGLRLGFHDGADEHKRDLTKTHETFLKHYTDLNESTGLYADLTAGLMINQASVDDLNSKIESDTVIAPEHFRPNFIVEGEGAPPYVEDFWRWIKIGNAIFKNVKPCTRCMFTTINPETGVRNTNREPLRTLEKYRKLKDVLKIDYEGELTVMGVMLAVHQEGEIKVNDTIYVGI